MNKNRRIRCLSSISGRTVRIILFSCAALLPVLLSGGSTVTANASWEMPRETLTVASAGTSRSASTKKSAKTDASASSAQKNQASAATAQKNVNVIFSGEIDGEGTFVFQGSTVTYRHSLYQKPRNVMINGKSWSDLGAPFDLGFTPDYSKTRTLDKSGRNTIRVSTFPDRAELYIYDSDGSSSQYRVSLSFQTASGSQPPVTDTPVVSETESVDKLRGVFYDLKRASDGSSTYLLELQDGKQFNRLRTWQLVWNLPDTAGKESVMVPFMKRFVLSNWPCRIDPSGNLFYREFSKFSRSSSTPYQSYFYQPVISSDLAPSTLSEDPVNSDIGWVIIHSGYVVAPFTGKFRFVGYGNDALVVRFDKQLVLDYGAYALSIGKKLDDTWDYYSILSGNAARTDGQKRPVLDNPIYSKCKLERYFDSLFDKHGVAKGVPISVQKGKFYPIEILFSDMERNGFCMALFVERLDEDGNPLNDSPERLPLFRTNSDLPSHQGGSFPDFDENSPIWLVVDSNGKRIQPPKPSVAEPKEEEGTGSSDSEEKNQSADDSDSVVIDFSEKNTEKEQKQDPPAPADEKSEQPKRDNPIPDKTVSTIKRGNVTTQTVTEHKGDTTIETVTTTEENGDTTVQTTVMTETKNGVVVRKVTSTTTTVNQTPASDLASDAAGQKETAKPEAGSSAGTAPAKTDTPNKTDSSGTGEKYNPFGYTRPPGE